MNPLSKQASTVAESSSAASTASPEAPNKQRSKYFATAAKMDEALLSLLETKDLAFITVKEICAAAGVNRSTFYLHYETIGDLLTESVEHMNREFLTYMGKDPGSFISRLHDCPDDELFLITPEYLEPYLSYIKQHRRLFRTTMENSQALDLQGSYEKMFRHVFEPILERFGVPSDDREYLMAFYIRGIMAIIGKWLETDCADSIDHLIRVMQRCIARA